MNGIVRLFQVCILAIFFESLLCAQTGQMSHSELLSRTVLRLEKSHKQFILLTPSSGWNAPGPNFVPTQGLDNPTAVPFLVNILNDGPQWSEEGILQDNAEIYSHIAQCYAVLCLGSIRDASTFDLLLETLQNGKGRNSKASQSRDWEGRYEIKRYAAYALGEFGDRRAVNQLIITLRTEKFQECIYALSRLGAGQAVSVIIQVASEANTFDIDTHMSLQNLLGTKFKIRRVKDGYRVDEFPELGNLNSRTAYKQIWDHWQRVGVQHAERKFRENYIKLKNARQESPQDYAKHRHIERQMLGGGGAALPFLLEEIENGDSSLIQPLNTLIKRRQIGGSRHNGVANTDDLKTRQDCITWWNANKDYWVILDSPKEP
jgi:hypothetical protein